MISESRADAAGVRKAPRHEIAMEHVTAVPRALWGLYERGTVKPDLSALFTFIQFVYLENLFYRPDPDLGGAQRARSVKDGAIAPPSGLVLD